MTKILEFHIENPPVKLGDDIVEDDIVGNSRISKKKRHPLTPRNSRIPKDKSRIPSFGRFAPSQ